MLPNFDDDVFFVNRWLLRCAGLWAPDSPTLKLLFRMYAVLVFLFVNVYFTATEFLSLFYTYTNLYSFIKNINFFLTHFMGAVKVVFWFFKGGVLRGLMETLERRDLRHIACKLPGYDTEAIWSRYRKIGFKYTLMFLLLAHLTLSSSYLPPLFTAVWYPPGNGSEFYTKLPYFSWMPFRHNTPGSYVLALGYQAGPMFSYAYSIVGMDTLFMNIMNFIAAHFTLLQGAFLTCKERVARDFQAEDAVRAMDDDIKENCYHLQEILRVCEKLELVHKFLTLGQVIATLFILCTCLYLISTTPVGSKQFFAEIIYMCAMGFQIYLFCWFGNEVTLLASELPLYIWKADWFNASRSFKANMIFTMTRMKKPIYLTVGKFAPLTLQTFMMVLKTSYSIFAVIKNRN